MPSPGSESVRGKPRPAMRTDSCRPGHPFDRVCFLLWIGINFTGMHAIGLLGLAYYPNLS